MNPTPTPRTDAALLAIDPMGYAYVPAELARTLERELNEARDNIVAQTDAIDQLRARVAELEQDKARLDWLECKHAASDGEFYKIENSITYRGNTGSAVLFPATRQAIDAAREKGAP